MFVYITCNYQNYKITIYKTQFGQIVNGQTIYVCEFHCLRTFERCVCSHLKVLYFIFTLQVLEGELEDGDNTSTVAVKILNQNATLEDKARFLDEARVYRDMNHENVLPFIAKCLQEDPWILIFELCSMVSLRCECYLLSLLRRVICLFDILRCKASAY